MSPTDHDTDADPFAADLAARLDDAAGHMTAPPDGRDRIAGRVRHRRNRRRTAVLGSVAVFAVAVIGVAGVIGRHADPDDARVADTTPTSAPVPTTALAVPPAVVPAVDMALQLPGTGYTWGIRTWGAESYDMLVEETGTDQPQMMLAGGVSDASMRLLLETPGFEQVDVDGRPVIVDRGAGNKSSGFWKPTPQTRVTVLAGPLAGGGPQLADSILRLAASTHTATGLEVRAVASALVTDPRSLFALGPHEVWLDSLRSPSGVPGDALSVSSFQLWSPSAGWGSVKLEVWPGADPRLPEGRDVTAGTRTVRLFPTEPPGPRMAAWMEDGYRVNVTYAADLPEDELLGTIARLHRPEDPQEYDDLILPDWRPASWSGPFAADHAGS